MPYISVKHEYLILSIIKPLKRVDTLLSKTGRLAEMNPKSNNKKKHSLNILLNNFVKVKITQVFLDKNLLLDKNLDKYSNNWEDISLISSLLSVYKSFESYNR